MKGIYADKSAWFQFGLLITLFLVGLLFLMVGYLTVGVFDADNASAGIEGKSFYAIQAMQFISVVLLFLFPSIGLAYLCSKRPVEYLSVRRMTDMRVYILTILMIFLIYPTIDITAYFNSKMQLPEFMAPIEDMMRKSEDLARETTMRLLLEEGVMPLIVNIMVVAVMAGLVEEFLFRGVLLSILRKVIKSPHVAIWLVAVIFSAIHFQFYGFVPRIILGALLGYLLYWSGSIWVPVFAHFLNNAIAVVGVHIANRNEGFMSRFSSMEPEIAAEDLIPTTIAAIVGLIFFVVCAKAMKRIRLSAEKS